MKAMILVFSPGGHTAMVGEKLGEILVQKNVEVQMINMTGKSILSRKEELTEWLEKNSNPHDVLFVGAPVYAGHLESNMVNILHCLPEPNSKWAGITIPFRYLWRST